MSSTRIGFEPRLRQAVSSFWSRRASSAAKQRAAGRSDQGNRGAVTGGKTMDSFRDMIVDIVKRRGPKGVEIYRDKSMVVLPDFSARPNNGICSSCTSAGCWRHWS